MKWCRDNPAIYNHWSANYKVREVKQDLIAEKAQKMCCTYGLVDRWINSFRNYYVKLTKSKSGQATGCLTDRQRWVTEMSSSRPTSEELTLPPPESQATQTALQMMAMPVEEAS